MRTLSLLDHLLFKDICTSDSRNLCLHDVDNDGDNELIIGCWESGSLTDNGDNEVEHIDGSLCVLKYNKLWKASYHLGMVSCVAAGNIVSPNVTWIIALCADSHCYVFDATIKVHDSLLNNNSNSQSTNKSTKHDSVSKTKRDTLKIVHHQQLTYNAKDVCLLNQGEIAVAHSDRVVRLYKWSKFDNSTDTSHNGEFVLLIKWELAGQVNRIDTCWTAKHGLMLIASQPSGGFAHLQKKFEKHQSNVAPILTYYPPQVINSRNLETRTWLVGNINGSSLLFNSPESDSCKGENNSNNNQETCNTDVDNVCELNHYGGNSLLMSLCTADGHVVLVNPVMNQSTDLLLWSTQLHIRGELFGLCKIKLTKDEGEQICVCSWDGTTYIFDLNKKSFRLQLGQSCQSFLGGSYAIEPGQNQCVFIYCTFDNQTLIYYGINLDHVAQPTLSSLILSNQELVKKFKQFKSNVHDPDWLCEFVHYLLYKYPQGQTNRFLHSSEEKST